MEGEGSRVTSLACSWIPREAEEPGKEAEQAAPLPTPRGLGDWESSFLHRPAPQSPGAGDALTLLVPVSGEAESSTDVHPCSPGRGSNAVPRTGVCFPHAVLLNIHPHPRVPTPKPQMA